MSKKRKVIQVIHSDSGATLFVIEGFEYKNVDIDYIKDRILDFFASLHDRSEVKIEPALFANRFIVSTKSNSLYVYWSWVTSYDKREDDILTSTKTTKTC